MAGDWIKLEAVTPDKPEVLRMADIIGIAPEHVLGCLIRVWIWADQQSLDGNALTVTETALDRIACNAGVTQAMCEVGWARKLSTGKGPAFTLTNFSRHNGKTAKDRALTRERVKKSRNALVTPKPLPEKRRDSISITIPSRETTESTKPAAHSTAKAAEALEESRQAAQHAVPMPEHLRAQFTPHKPDQASESQAEPKAGELGGELERILASPGK